jgi:hypothetical protein
MIFRPYPLARGIKREVEAARYFEAVLPAAVELHKEGKFGLLHLGLDLVHWGAESY